MRQWDKALWQTVSPLLDRALDLDASERRAFLATVRGDQPQAADALERLLVEHDRAHAAAFLGDSPFADHAAPSLAGQIVGAYRLDRPLGSGGMGTVWLARRIDGRYDAAVAIKFVNLSALDPIGQERFRREGTLLARLSHPHIARLLDAGVTSGGQPYLVLEYVEGARIDRYAADRRLGVDARLRLFLQVADAVAHAHTNLIVHRDLKPSNVLVDAGGRVKLLDFGIATLVDAGSMDEGASVTVTGSRVLTPEHAAPEQLTGGTVTTAIDVYALGVLLYQLIVGRHPTVPKSAATQAEVIRAVIEQEPGRMSDAVDRLADDSEARQLLEERGISRERLRRSCRGDLDVIVGKALKRDPRERYETVMAFADDVRRHLRHEAVAARPDSVWYRARRFAGRHRVEVAAAAAVAIALVAGTGIAVRQARASARERDLALERLRRAEATNDFSGFLLSQATPHGRPISNADLLAQGEALITKRFAGDPALRVHMLLTLADRYQENQQFDDMRRVLHRAYDDSRTLPDPGLRAYAACALALEPIEKDDAPKALAIVADALPILASSTDYAEFESGCRVYESVAAKRKGDSARAIAAAERAVALAESSQSAPGREVDPLAALASSYVSAFEYGKAEPVYRRIVTILDTQGLGETRQAAVILNNWSVMLLDSGQPLAAAGAAARAVRIARTADSENGASLSMLTTYATALAATGDAKAATVFDEALEKARRAGSPARLISTLLYAIQNSCDAHDLDRAARLLGEAEHALGGGASAHSKGLVQGSRARVALARGDLAAAVDAASLAATTLEAATPNQASFLPALTFLAEALNASGRFGEALATADRAVDLATSRARRLPHTAALGLALLQRAVARNGLGDAAGARVAAEQALEQLLPAIGPQARATVLAESLRRRAAREPDA